MEKVNLAQKFALFDEHWRQKIVGEVNDFFIKLVKLKGEFIWHRHEVEDELFFVVRGRLLMELDRQKVWLEEGEFLIVPHGVEHRPVAPEEVHVMLIEPKATANTGGAADERAHEPEWL